MKLIGWLKIFFATQKCRNDCSMRVNFSYCVLQDGSGGGIFFWGGVRSSLTKVELGRFSSTGPAIV